ncbi:periplasmic serine endoprotease DegP precursor [bacterium BMS3Abin02]|nr:periplasmic serine endoprotease DegP precursor [bacterium BMS3Abin02]HDL50361.1 PDZ domain-containing protein [Actinomycetota bacterium]
MSDRTVPRDDDPRVAPPRPPLPPEQPARTAVARGRGVLPAALIGGILGAALAVGALFAIDALPSHETFTASTSTTLPSVAPAQASSPSTAVATIAAKAIPSIVTVEVGDGNGLTDRASASGSGVVYTANGLILTNNHVVEGAGFVRIVLSDGRIYQATVVGADPVTDLAVISIDASDLTPLQLANPSSYQIGDLAIAIGNPLGLYGGPSVTSGIISAFNRELEVTASERLFGLLQTDAPITRGSSGGALLDANGRLIGITTAIGLSDVGAEGLGFAVPVSIVQGVANDLIRDGVVRHAFIGVQVEPAFENIGGAQVPEGARILSFEGDTGIQDTGAEVGDIITAIDGISVIGVRDLIALLRTHRAGQTVTLSLLRDGNPIELDAVLGQRPPDQP